MIKAALIRTGYSVFILALLLPPASAEAGTRRKPMSAPNHDQPVMLMSSLTASECRKLGGVPIVDRRCAAHEFCTAIQADGTVRTACIDELG